MQVCYIPIPSNKSVVVKTVLPLPQKGFDIFDLDDISTVDADANPKCVLCVCFFLNWKSEHFELYCPIEVSEHLRAWQWISLKVQTDIQTYT
jgi:hypothetical protein